MALSRKDFRMVANIIQMSRNITNYGMEEDYDDYIAVNNALDYLVDCIAIGFEQSNSRFDSEKFKLACRM
tara:strand:+ start:391 stop:600 length:210 start_codon:yes stop_codon:yes gene_type:complete